MPKPRRRRRFFALDEERFTIERSNKVQDAFDPAQAALSLPDEGDSLHDDLSQEEASLKQLGISDATPFALKPERARRVIARLGVRATLMVTIAMVSMLLGALAAYYFLDKSASNPAVKPVQETSTLLTITDFDELNAAFAALNTGHLDTAEQLFTALERKHPGWTSMQVEVGRTLLHRQNYLGARAALNGAVDHGTRLTEADLLIGVAYNAEKSYPEAEASFAQTVARDPTQADAFFLWGECLREQGKLSEAITKYRAALLRNEDETGAGLYRLKLWLCEIEAGVESDSTKTEISAALTKPFPPMENLFATAAQELKAGDLRGAATHLIRARERADPQIFLAVLNDPFFVQARSTPQLAEMIRSISVMSDSKAVGPAGGFIPDAVDNNHTPTTQEADPVSPTKAK